MNDLISIDKRSIKIKISTIYQVQKDKKMSNTDKTTYYKHNIKVLTKYLISIDCMKNICIIFIFLNLIYS